MWTLQVPWYELIFRAVCVFTFLFLVFRVWGKKHFGQLTTFDFILVLIISEAVQNALVGDDHSVAGGFITVFSLVILNVILNKITFWSRSAEKLFDGQANILISDGVIDHKMMRKVGLTMSELEEAMREGGVLEASEVRRGTMETDGHVSIVKHK